MLIALFLKVIAIIVYCIHRWFSKILEIGVLKDDSPLDVEEYLDTCRFLNHIP